MQMLAEGARFELAVHVNGRRFSRPVPSTTRPPLRIKKSSSYRLLAFSCFFMFAPCMNSKSLFDMVLVEINVTVVHRN